jgi:molybdopterin-guanine dinucleotide biosynthesis protein A
LADVGAIVLAGGRGRRLSPDKGRLVVAGRPIVTRALEAAAQVAERVVVVGSARLPSGLDVTVVPDDVPYGGPLHALLLGMRALGTRVALLVAWDMPFVSPQVLRYLCEGLGDDSAAIPVVDGQPQPLCAAYADSCAGVIESFGDGVNLPMWALFPRVPVRWVLEQELARFGEPRRLFFNVNTAADLELARAMATEEVPDVCRSQG